MRAGMTANPIHHPSPFGYPWGRCFGIGPSFLSDGGRDGYRKTTVL